MAEERVGERSDDEITADVVRVLWSSFELQPGDLRRVEVATRRGVVVLNGYTSSEQSRALIEKLARSVRGVRDVLNDLESFEALARAARELEASGHGKPR